MLRDMPVVPDDRDGRGSFTNVRRRLSGAVDVRIVVSEAARAKEVPASVVHETAADGLVEGGHHHPAPNPLKSGDKTGLGTATGAVK